MAAASGRRLTADGFFTTSGPVTAWWVTWRTNTAVTVQTLLGATNPPYKSRAQYVIGA